MTLRDLLQPEILKPFRIALTMYFILNLSGLNIMIFYCNSIFQYSGSSLNYNVASIIVAIVLLLSSFFAIVIISRLPRKVILVTSISGMAICYIVLGACFQAIEKGAVLNTLLLKLLLHLLLLLFLQIFSFLLHILFPSLPSPPVP